MHPAVLTYYFCLWMPVSGFPLSFPVYTLSSYLNWDKIIVFPSGHFFLWTTSLTALSAPSTTSYSQCYAIFLPSLVLELFLILHAFTFIFKSHLIKFSLPSLFHSKHCLLFAIWTLNVILSMVSFRHLSRETRSFIMLSTTISNSKMPCTTVSWKPFFYGGWGGRELHAMLKHHYFLMIQYL